MLTRVFHPAHDLVVIDDAAGRERGIVVEIGHSSHADGFANNGTKHVATITAAVYGHVIVRGVNCGGNLTVAATIDMRGDAARRLNPIEEQVGRLVSRVQHSLAADVNVALEIDLCLHTIAENDL